MVTDLTLMLPHPKVVKEVMPNFRADLHSGGNDHKRNWQLCRGLTYCGRLIMGLWEINYFFWHPTDMAGLYLYSFCQIPLNKKLTKTDSDFPCRDSQPGSPMKLWQKKIFFSAHRKAVSNRGSGRTKILILHIISCGELLS